MGDEKKWLRSTNSSTTSERILYFKNKVSERQEPRPFRKTGASSSEKALKRNRHLFKQTHTHTHEHAEMSTFFSNRYVSAAEPLITSSEAANQLP